MNKRIVTVGTLALFLLASACQTKAELRRQQEVEHLKEEVSASREGRADIQDTIDELKAEVARLGNAIEAKNQQAGQQFDAMQKDIAALQTRMQALEQRAVAQEMAAKTPPPAPEPHKITFDDAKKLFDDGKYDEAVEALKPIAHAKGRSDEKVKAQFLLAESYFGNRDYASAALAYGEFQKANPRDPLLPNSILGQARAFKNMGKKKEAKLFYQDLVDRFPKSKVAIQARKEMKHLK